VGVGFVLCLELLYLSVHRLVSGLLHGLWCTWVLCWLGCWVGASAKAQDYELVLYVAETLSNQSTTVLHLSTL
jgi:hypothetical protein